MVGVTITSQLMACQLDIMMLQPFALLDTERSENSFAFIKHSHGTGDSILTPNFRRQTSKFDFISAQKRHLSSKQSRKIAFALNTGGFTDNNSDENNLNGENFPLGGTRLGRIVGAGGRELLNKLNSARKNFPMKVFLLLFGFYTANALATILGQTGDWDVLVAGVVVAAIEGIGALMYKKPISSGRLQNLVVMINYWKAGVCLGLFVDAFKLGS